MFYRQPCCENGGGGERIGEMTYLEADILQVLGVLLDDLLNEVRVSGAQVRRSRLIELKLKSPPGQGCERHHSSSGTQTRPWRGLRGTNAGRFAGQRGEAGYPSPLLESAGS